MFYSQTFLARKGPLGTVWCAAHLQSRLKKSHYTFTDIPSTVDRIMFPDVPIALRMSGHLLVGVVRIYSKKVDYLYQECNFVLTSLRKAFPSIDLNLPENTRQAPVDTITLPETFDLDALNLDYDVFHEGVHDNNISSREDILIPDQIPSEQDRYVAIKFDEDIRINSPHPKEVPSSDAAPIDEDTTPIPTDATVHSQGNHDDFTRPEVEIAIQDPNPSNRIENIGLIHKDDSFPPQHDPEIEITLHGATNINSEPRLPVSSTNWNDVMEANRSVDPAANEVPSSDADLMDVDIIPAPVAEAVRSPGNYTDEQIGSIDEFTCPEPGSIDVMRHDSPHINSKPLTPFPSYNGNDSTQPKGSVEPAKNENDYPSPATEEDIHSDALFQPNSGPHTPIPPLGEYLINTNGTVSFELQPTPPVEQPRARPRKRKQHFDETLVLSNEFMNKTIQDASDLVRKRRKIPSSALSIWQLINQLRKEQMFLQPSLSGMCSDLCNVSNKDYISTKSYLFEEVSPNSGVAHTPVTEASTGHKGAQPPPLPTEHSPVTETSMGHKGAQSPPLTTEHSPEGSTGHKGTLSPPLTIERSPVTEASTGHMGAQSPLPGITEASPENMVAPDTEASTGHMGAESPPHTTEASPETMVAPVTEDFMGHMGAQSPPRTPEASPDKMVAPVTGEHDGRYTLSQLTDAAKGKSSLRKDDLPSSSPNTGLALSSPLETSTPALDLSEAEDLSFLLADNNTPAGSQGAGTVDSLSVRTRAAAQYLKRKSPISPTSEGPFGDLSMEKILEGKPRKLCARMFYETLVLKTYGLVDVKQEVLYGDIRLKFTQTLSKAQI